MVRKCATLRAKPCARQVIFLVFPQLSGNFRNGGTASSAVFFIFYLTLFFFFFFHYNFDGRFPVPHGTRPGRFGIH